MTEDEIDHWEQHWNDESKENDREATGSEKEEKERINALVLQKFNETVERRKDGYYVQLPFKAEHEELPDNKALAWRRLKSILLKYSTRPDVLEQYDSVFKEQLKNGILEEVNENMDSVSSKKHYLPHQPVITPQKHTTKFRVVFDASAHYKGCPSLNDVLHQGPTLLPRLYGILLRFRTGAFVLLSDVEKAFLQVRIKEEDRDFTRCLWLKDIKDPLTPDNLAVYRFTRVTFGINASPFLLSATILFHLRNSVTNKQLAQEIATNLYVDNLFVSAESENEAIRKYTEAKSIFKDIQMNLREFVSNSQAIMRSIPADDQSANQSPKVLGIRWNSVSDEFELNITTSEKTFVCKRTVAQQLASIYDPLGWCIPLLIKLKHFQQQLWKQQYQWDEPLSQADRDRWLELIQNINHFQHTLPRRIAEPMVEFIIVTYTDASSIATAACTYLASAETSRLLMAKSKVSDAKKQITIPKLELSAIAMGTRLSLNVFRSLQSVLPIDRIIILTDSEIALNWITSTNYRSNGVFVANRVREIHEMVHELETLKIRMQFGYIETTSNPADCGTRGLSQESFKKHIWWTGYNLHQLQVAVGKTLCRIPEEDGEEQPTDEHLHVTVCARPEEVTDIIDLQRYSSTLKAKRILAFALRFINGITSRLRGKLRSKLLQRIPGLQQHSQKTYLTAEELLEAQNILIRNHQKVHITNQYRKELTRNLNLKEDQDNILRAYGRLNRSDLSAVAKNPIIITPNTELSRMIILDSHGMYHNGVAHTMSEVRQLYWIPKLREQVKKVVRLCIPCQKMNNLPYKYPEMTDLPKYRVAKARPFQHIGLDYFGPLTVFREDMVRSTVYGCIFTCAVTRMIHIEIVADGTTEKFINAFRRFVARRGKPESVTCDNAPTFILGSSVMNATLEKESEQSLEAAINNQCIKWYHITPYSPWKGGFYERLIKSVKTSLFKAIGKRILTMDQFLTILTEVEACLNTRPLTYQETEFKDNTHSLRPIDFIQNEMEITLQMENFELEDNDPSYIPPTEEVRLRTRMQTIKALQSSCALADRYWRIWKDSYLTALREQHRRNMDRKRGCAREPHEGDIVLIVDSCQKRYNWKLGKVTKLVHGEDGAVREAEVYASKNNTVRRPVNQLVPLEIGGCREIPDQQGKDTHVEEVRENEEVRNLSAEPRYNLRPRPSKKVYSLAALSLTSTCVQLLLTVLSAALVAGEPQRMHSNVKSSPLHIIECRKEGVYIHSPHAEAYELCVNDYCMTEHAPPNHQVVHIPASELLHSYEARWKIRTATNYTTIETMCPAQPFCSSIQCTLCAENIFNPECWPIAAIAGAGIILYVVIALCYTILYIPVTIGRPIRLLVRAVADIMFFCSYIFYKCIESGLRCVRRRPTSRSSRLLEALALLCIISGVWTCQTVNVFSHHIKNCAISSGQRICHIELATVLKVNSFKRDACIRLQQNQTTVYEVRFHWNGLRLLCSKNSLFYTRNVIQKIVDSKRCPRMGSCINNKCADINASSLIPELSIGNTYPGATRCVESCGGPGCDCFFPSSGCLFYRIYAVPRDNITYEIFKCSRWQEEVKAKIQIRKPNKNHFKTYYIGLRPNIPTILPTMEVTLSMIAWPYQSILDTSFITHRNVTALWSIGEEPLLQCSTEEAAKSLQCTLLDSCECTPAESQVKCLCRDQDIEENLAKIDNVLPATFPFVRFTRHSTYDVMALMDHELSAEVVINIKEPVDSAVIDNIDETCMISNTGITGCYRCRKGANATITCASRTTTVLAEVQCDKDSFVVPCTPTGQKSSLHFLLVTARVHLPCKVKCGSITTTFEITGILRYVHSFQGRLSEILFHQHNSTLDFAWPDMSHIFDVYLQWHKAIVLTGVFVAAALAFTYIYVTVAGLRLLGSIFSILLCLIHRVIRIWVRIAGLVLKCTPRIGNHKESPNKDTKML